MEILGNIFDFFLHLDFYLDKIISNLGPLSYLFLFFIIFIETGLVVTPFLPGDSLLFAAGALSSFGSLNVFVLWIIVLLGAILGDTANYWIGHFFGQKLINPHFEIKFFSLKFKTSKFIKIEHVNKAQAFYDKHGGKAIVFARFVPIVRTFAPFVAGVGKMNYSNFIFYNIAGGFCWVTIFIFLGFFFGEQPFVKENFHYLAFGIIFISIIPLFIEFTKSRLRK